MTRFLVDAQLPVRLARFIRSAGFDTLHTRDLPEGNATTDAEINRVSLVEKRVVITKDTDFATSVLMTGRPYKLLLVNTGNTRNTELLALFEKTLSEITEHFEVSVFVELTREAIVVHL